MVETLDGVALYPPLGPEPAALGAPFDSSLLPGLSVVLETDDGATVRTVATFDRTTTPALHRLDQHSVYFVNVPAAAHFTTPALAYRFRVLSDGVELARSDLSERVFAVLAKNPGLLVGVKVRVELRAAPSIDSIDPASSLPSAGDVSITVRGSSFTRDSSVRFGERAVPTTFISSRELTATVPEALLTAIGTAPITVSTPAPGGGTSNALTFTVRNPAAVLTGLSPASARVGAGSVTVTLNGSSFVAGAQARLGLTDLATTFVSATQLTALVPSTLLTAAGTFDVSVTNPAPGGGASGALSFTVEPAAPPVGITWDPAHASAGVTLTNDQLTASAQPSAGIPGLRATASISGGRWYWEVTNNLDYVMVGVADSSWNLAYSSGPAHLYYSYTGRTWPGDATFGGAYGPGTVVGVALDMANRQVSIYRNGVLQQTRALGSVGTVWYPAAVLQPGYPSTARITANFGGAPFSYAPPTGFVSLGTCTSSPCTGTAANLAPSLTSISPAAATVGSAAVTITLNGASFSTSSIATFNGANLTTTYVSTTQLTANVPSTSLTTAGSYTVTVTTPAPGGGTSAAQTFNVTAPVVTTTTWDAAHLGGGVVLSNGQLTASTVSGIPGLRATTAIAGGRYYWEVRANTEYVMVGVADQSWALGYGSGPAELYYSYSGASWPTNTAFGTIYHSGDVIGVALDATAGQVTMYKNGVLQATRAIATSTLWYPAAVLQAYLGDARVTANFGASAFAHAVPSGYTPLDACSSSPCR
ncbi:IPT/TIG domain-containing protein [Myxococcota bacterium]|nr:IPT/TIG domain-containing protein [Myxococcota bacterium]